MAVNKWPYRSVTRGCRDGEKRRPLLTATTLGSVEAVGRKYANVRHTAFVGQNPFFIFQIAHPAGKRVRGFGLAPNVAGEALLEEV